MRSGSDTHDTSEAALESSAVLERARTGTRLMTIRGALMRVISIGANILLLVLVSPSELGLLAVARGTFALLQYLAEPGIGKALLRRAQTPTKAEYAALAGLQIAVGLFVIGMGALWGAPILGFGALDTKWHLAMLGTVTTILSLALGTGARIRLERSLAYERLAVVDVLNVLILNVGLLAFALAHRFSIGVFVLLGISTVASNVLMYRWAPGPRPSLSLRPLLGVARESSGFLMASTCQVLREQGTPVLIGSLFGLQIAGLYSFAERVAQVLNVTFEGFRNASIPAAARLTGDLRSLKALASRTLAGSTLLTAPLAVLAIAGLPMLGYLLPKWAGAVTIAQWYVAAYALYGVLAAAMEPAAVAAIGSRAAITEQGTALLIGWSAFALVRFAGAELLPVAIVLMYLTPVVALRLTMPAAIRPSPTAEVRRVGLAVATSLALYVALRALALGPLIAALVPPIILFAAIPRFRNYPSAIAVRLLSRRVDA